LRSCRLQPAEQSLDHNDHNDLDDQLLSQNSRGAAGWHWTWGAVVLAAAPVNAVARLAVAALERARGGRTRGLPRAPVRPAVMTLGQVREAAAGLLPGCVIRRLLFWRYLLVFRRPQDP